MTDTTNISGTTGAQRDAAFSSIFGAPRPENRSFVPRTLSPQTESASVAHQPAAAVLQAPSSPVPADHRLASPYSSPQRRQSPALFQLGGPQRQPQQPQQPQQPPQPAQPPLQQQLPQQLHKPLASAPGSAQRPDGLRIQTSSEALRQPHQAQRGYPPQQARYGQLQNGVPNGPAGYPPAQPYSQRSASSPTSVQGRPPPVRGGFTPNSHLYHHQQAFNSGSEPHHLPHHQTLQHGPGQQRTQSLTSTARFTVGARPVPQRSSDILPAGTNGLSHRSTSTSLLSFKGSTRSLSTKHSASSSKLDEQGRNASYPNLSPRSTVLTASRSSPLVYPALLSKVAEILMQRLTPGDRIKNELTYKNSFTGAETVDAIAYIIKTPDRNLALLLGRALDAQKFFHDVTYEHRLRDSQNEVYQFETHYDNPDAAAPAVRSSPSTTSLSARPSNASTSGMALPAVNVNGVFTLLAECYSPTCTRDQLCYSIACPRRLEQQARSGLQRAESRLSLHGDEEKEQKLWIHSVSKEVADSVDDREKKRQEIICEVIYTERDFVKDLEYMEDCWVGPLRARNIIPEARKDKVVNALFGEVKAVHAVNAKLAEALTRRQQQAPVVDQIGDVFLQYVDKFQTFVRYGANQPKGKETFDREKSINPTFVKFVEETERRKESRKLEINGYLTKPTTRLARYPLLLENVLKYTQPGNPDMENIPKAIAIIREFLSEVNVASGRADNRIVLEQLASQLVPKDEAKELRLGDEYRELVFKSSLKKRTQDKDNQGDVQVYLFDHALLFVRLKIINKRKQLKIHRKPIPLPLLILSESEEVPQRSLSMLPASSIMGSSKSTTKPEGTQNRYPITFQHLGRKGYDITLYATTYMSRKKWAEHIAGQQQKLIEKHDIFTERVMQEKKFDALNRINCMSKLDGGRKLLYGTDRGIYVCEVRFKDGVYHTTNPELAVSIAGVTQVDILEEYNLLLCLADRNFYVWNMDIIEQQPRDPLAASRKGNKMFSHASFYKVGICLGQILLCIVKSSSFTSTIRVLQCTADPRQQRKQQSLRSLLNKPEPFKLYKEFSMSSETVSISFLKTKVCVGSSKGFEIASLETLETQALLDPADTSLDFATKSNPLRPIAIYRLGSDFLLNYADYSFFVNCNGWRSRPEWLVHWEGTPQHFALSYPYIIAFEPNFIEIRDLETSEIVRAIVGENIRFLRETTSEILYVREDENGRDQVLSLDFWEKSNKAAAARNHESTHSASPASPSHRQSVMSDASTLAMREF